MICSKRGALLHRVDDSRFRVLTPLDETTLYQWHTQNAKDYFCPACGILPFRRPRTAPEMWSVNIRCLEGVDLGSIPVKHLQGSKLD